MEITVHTRRGIRYALVTADAPLITDAQTALDMMVTVGYETDCNRIALPKQAVAENFFGILKSECLRRHKPKTIEQAKLLIDNFIYFYNHERIQLKTKLTPLEKRRQFA